MTRLSTYFLPTEREPPAEAEALSHKLMVRAGLVRQVGSGLWSWLPAGWRVQQRIIQIVREEMNAIGGQEMLMPVLQPAELWKRTGRYDIEELFKHVAVDTPVRIVNQPHKVGWEDGQLYAEVHPPLEATDSGVFEPDRTALARLIANAVRAHGEASSVNWSQAETAFEQARGIPVAVTTPASAAGVAAVR